MKTVDLHWLDLGNLSIICHIFHSTVDGVSWAKWDYGSLPVAVNYGICRWWNSAEEQPKSHTVISIELWATDCRMFDQRSWKSINQIIDVFVPILAKNARRSCQENWCPILYDFATHFSFTYFSPVSFSSFFVVIVNAKQ